jgi:hypothetical protein
MSGAVQTVKKIAKKVIGPDEKPAPIEPIKKIAPKITPGEATAIGDEPGEGAPVTTKAKKRKPSPYDPVLTTPYGDIGTAPVKKKALLGA